MNRRQTLSLLMAAGLGACFKREDGLRIWAMGTEGEKIVPFINAFNHKTTGPKFRSQALPWSAAHEKLLTAFAADNLPDVIALGNTWVSEFAALDALEPLNQYGIDTSNMFEAAVDNATIDGKLLGLPWYVETRLLFYRNDNLARAGFQNPPQTWAEWEAQLAALGKIGGNHKFGAFMPVNEFEPLVAFCLQSQNQILIDNATKGGFQTNGIKETFAFVKSLYDKGYAAILSGAEAPDLYASFGRGEFTFVITGPWNIAEMRKRLPADAQDKWATAPLPGRTGLGASILGGVSLGINKASTQKMAALELIKELTNVSVQAEFSKATADLPSVKPAWALAGLETDAKAHSFYQQLSLAKAAPKAPEWERIANEMAIAMERVVRGIQSLDVALAGLDNFADDILAKRRYMISLKGNAHE
ncbi:MAG: extracellular solute-binding protein [Pseudomonadota bacterium]